LENPPGTDLRADGTSDVALARDPKFARSFAIRIGLFYACYFVMNGVYLPFFPPWLASRGLTPDDIAICLAMPQLARLFVQPWASAFADRARNRRHAIILFSLGALVCFVPVGMVDSFVGLVVVCTVSFTIWHMVLPATEALALTGVRQLGLDYGRMRLVGSFGFIAASLAAGVVVNHLGLSSVYWMLVGSLALAAAYAFALPVTPPALRTRDDAGRRPAGPTRLIARDRVLVAVMVANALMQASHSMLYGFASLFWLAQGFSSQQVSILWTTGVVAEIILFAFITRIGRIVGTYRLLLISVGAGLLRWSLFVTEPGFTGFLLLQTLHAASFGAAFLGMQRALAMRVPDERMSSAQGLGYTISAATMLIGTLAAGPLYRALGGQAFVVMLVPVAIALAIMLTGRQQLRKIG
jgi:PPP family 3-phenylpropionic acid transporter